MVIGGGHNGLVAAAYLAKNGLDTLVCERRGVSGMLFPNVNRACVRLKQRHWAERGHTVLNLAASRSHQEDRPSPQPMSTGNKVTVNPET